MSSFFLRLFLCFCMGGTVHLLWGQVSPRQIELWFQEGKLPEALDASVSLLRSHPASFAATDPAVFSLERILPQDDSLQPSQIQGLLEVYRFFETLYPDDALQWLRMQGLAVMIYQDALSDDFLPVLRQCLDRSPEAMPPMMLEHFSEGLLRRIEAGSGRPEVWVDNFCFLENLWLNLDTWNPDQVAQAGVYRLRMAEALQVILPDCQRLQTDYQSRLNRDLLRPEDYRYLYTCLRLNGCSRTGFRDSVLYRYPDLAKTPYAYRVAAMEALQQGAYEQAIRWLERCLELEDRPQFRAQDYLRLAELYRQLTNFRTARLYVEYADQNLPQWGRPYLFLAEMVVQSGPFCNFTPLEQKAINWLAIDYCEVAMNRNPRLKPLAIRQIQQYQQAMPSQEEVLFYGFQLGDSFPLRCWLETATRVRY